MYTAHVCDAMDVYVAVNELHAAVTYDDIAFLDMSVPALNAYVIHCIVEQLNAAHNYVHLAIFFCMGVVYENGGVAIIKVQETVFIRVNPLYCSEAFVFVARVLAVEVEELLQVVLHCLISIIGCRAAVYVGRFSAGYFACENLFHLVGIAFKAPTCMMRLLCPGCRMYSNVACQDKGSLLPLCAAGSGTVYPFIQALLCTLGSYQHHISCAGYLYYAWRFYFLPEILQIEALILPYQAY